MKKIFILITTLATLLLSSCQKPQFIETTADRQGLTSLTAIFTFGPYVDQELAKLIIDDDSIDRFVIPIPYYYPITSDNQTIGYMSSVRVQAELQPNYKLSPALTILDLELENEFTYTDPHGNSRKIIITGERVKSSECDVLSFTLNNPKVSGVVDKANRTIILPTKDDVSKSSATVAVSAHAEIFPDPSRARDYTKPVKFTVTAHDGTTAEYTVMTGDPEKIDMGINVDSIEKLFNFDPVSRLGMPDYTAEVAVSLASIEGKLVICLGNGETPVWIDGLTGDKGGAIKLGDAVPGSITNDEAGNMLITNVAQGGDNREAVKLYRTSSVNTVPELLYMFENPIDVPIGHKMKVFGNIDTKALVTYTAEGIAGVTSTAKVVYLMVETGEVKDIRTVDLSGVTAGWGPAPVNTATVVPASLDPVQDGWYYDYYEGNVGANDLYLLHHLNGNGKDDVIAEIGNWANNPNCLDSKSFNNSRYMTLFVVSHFPQWGIAPMLYVYDITDPSSPVLGFSNEQISWYQKGAAGIASGDVVLAPSTDGYKLYVYYYDHNAQVVGGYVGDCIKR